MATKSEDIRLSINNVKHKKGDGTLYLMAERLAWMPNTKNNFTISHKYSDIRMQKISPEGKAKIQLQIVLHTGDNTTFQFNNLEDRTAVKDALLQILPQFKGKMSKDREKKALLLSKNPNLLQLYKDLVETKVVSVEDFWSQFVDDISTDIPIETQSEQQDVGVSADFLAGIPLNGKQITGEVHVETLWAILKTYPKVAKKHQELVPTKMSETEFWNKFFQSRYFNRDRSKDLFSDCVKSDEKEWSSVMKKGILDPFLDLDMFNDNAYQVSADDPPASSSHDNPTQLLMKRFNQQSVRLLESLQRSGGDKNNETSGVQESSINSSQQQDSTGQTETTAKTTSTIGDKNNKPTAVGDLKTANTNDNTSFRANRRDWTYDDLAGHENNGDFLDDESRVGSRMHEVDKEKYSIVPQSQQQASLSLNSINDHSEAMKAWQPNPIDCINAKDATEALKNLSPAGYLMRATNSQRLEDTVSEELNARLKSTYFAANELLRHFWLCFPTVDSSLEAKVVKLHDTLKKFESSKLQTFHDSLSRDQRHLLNHIMRGQFKTAFRKYDSWKGKHRQKQTNLL